MSPTNDDRGPVPFPAAPIDMDDLDPVSSRARRPLHSTGVHRFPRTSADRARRRSRENAQSSPIPVVTVADERRVPATSDALSSDPTFAPQALYHISRTFKESEIPVGFMCASADMTSSVMAAARPRSSTTRTQSSTLTTGDSEERSQTQLQKRSTAKSQPEGALSTLAENQHPDVPAQDTAAAARLKDKEMPQTKLEEAVAAAGGIASGSVQTMTAVVFESSSDKPPTADDGGVTKGPAYENGYHFPPKYSTSESFRHGLVAFGAYAVTPVGFFVVVYGLNVVAWGGMIFLLLCNASPAMCHPTCNDINSPRRKWIEVDSQVLNGLFCVTGFGLAPWRFRDMYYWLRFRWAHDEMGLRRLAGLYRGWLRLPGSELLPVGVGPDHIPPETPVSAIPFPQDKIPDAPLTGERAPPTQMWRICFMLTMNLANTFLQVVLCGFMWGMNRYDRPSWSTGLFVALACVSGALGGLCMFVEGKRVKGIEGVPLTDEDRARLALDEAHGVFHYNNLQGRKPKSKKGDLEAGV